MKKKKLCINYTKFIYKRVLQITIVVQDLSQVILKKRNLNFLKIIIIL